MPLNLEQFDKNKKQGLNLAQFDRSVQPNFPSPPLTGLNIDEPQPGFPSPQDASLGTMAKQIRPTGNTSFLHPNPHEPQPVSSTNVDLKPPVVQERATLSATPYRGPTIGSRPAYYEGPTIGPSRAPSRVLEAAKTGGLSALQTLIQSIENIPLELPARFREPGTSGQELISRIEEMKPSLEPTRGVIPKTVEGISFLASDLPRLIALTRGFGTVGGLGAAGVLGQDISELEPEEIATEFGKGAAFGVGAKGLGALQAGQLGTRTAGAGLFATPTALEGAPLEDVVSSALTGAVFARPRRKVPVKPEVSKVQPKELPEKALSKMVKAPIISDKAPIKRALTDKQKRKLERFGVVPKEETYDKATRKQMGRRVPQDRESIESIQQPKRSGELAEPTRKITGKEPWEMTGSEFVNLYFESPKLKAALAKPPKRGRAIRDVAIDNITQGKWAEHKKIIQQALSEGKPVPESVLKDYPELQKRAVKVSTVAKKPDAGAVPAPSTKSTELGAFGITPSVVKGLGESTVKGMRKISETTNSMIEQAKGKPEIRKGVKEAKESMIGHDRRIRDAEFVSKQFEKTVNDVIKDPERQMLLIHAYEHKMRGPYWNKLNEIEKGVVRWIGKEKKKIERYIDDNKILERMPDNERINHIFHHWIDPKTNKPFSAMYGKFSKGLPQAKQRTIETYEAGIGKGLKPATQNIGKLIGLEWESVMRADQSRKMFKSLVETEGETGTLIQRVPGRKFKQIRMIERWDKLIAQGLADLTKNSEYVKASDLGPNVRMYLDKSMMIKTADGSLMRLNADVGIHKNLAPFVKAYIENPSYGNIAKINFISKSLKLGFSMFHVVSLGMQELANWRIPFKNIHRGLKLRGELGEDLRILHREGLELFKGYEDLGYRNSFFEGATKAGKFGNIVTKPIELMRSFIFDVVQPGMKTSFAVDTYNKILPKYLKRGKTKAQAARDAVEAADGHFSGEHYKRALLETTRLMSKLYFSPQARKFWQMLLLSPTWQREHLLVAKNVAKSFMPDAMIKKLGRKELGPIKAEYRKYLLGAVAMIGAVDMWNYMSTEKMDGKGRHLWENPKGKGFAVRGWWDEPDYYVTDKNGKQRKIKGGHAYIRPLKSVFEIAEGITDPVKKASYKLSPWVTGFVAQMPGYKYRSYEGIGAMPKRTWDFITDVSTPIAADQFIDWVKGKKTGKAATFPFFGMPVSKVKKSTKRSFTK